MKPVDILLVLVIAAIVAAAVTYIVRAKKKGLNVSAARPPQTAQKNAAQAARPGSRIRKTGFKRFPERFSDSVFAFPLFSVQTAGIFLKFKIRDEKRRQIVYSKDKELKKANSRKE